MDRGAWQATVHGVAKSLTGLSDFHSLCMHLPLAFSQRCYPINNPTSPPLKKKKKRLIATGKFKELYNEHSRSHPPLINC